MTGAILERIRPGHARSAYRVRHRLSGEPDRLTPVKLSERHGIFRLPSGHSGRQRYYLFCIEWFDSHKTAGRIKKVVAVAIPGGNYAATIDRFTNYIDREAQS